MNTDSLIELAGCIITDQESRLLLMHRPGRDEWELPGGRLEDSDEPYEVAAARELFEELGIDVEISESLGQTCWKNTSNGHNYCFHWFRGEIIEGSPAPRQEESDDVKFFSREELGQMDNLSPILKEILTQIPLPN